MSHSEQSSLHISLSEMLDLALGTPEVGTINFKILHNFLHVLLHLHNLKSVNLEYRGDGASAIKEFISSSEQRGINHHFGEFCINTNYGGKNLGNDFKNLTNIDIHVNDIILACSKSAQYSDTENSNDCTNSELEIKSTKIIERVSGENQENSEPVISLTPLINDSASNSINNSEKSITTLKEYLSDNESGSHSNGIEYIKDENDTPVAHLWPVVNINKRLDANEQDIDKDDEPKRLAGGTDVLEQVAHINKRLSELEGNMNSLSRNIESTPLQNPQTGDQIKSIHGIETNIVYNDENENISAKSATEKQLDINEKCSSGTSLEQKSDISDNDVLGEVDCCKMRADLMTINSTLDEVKQEICCLKWKFYDMSKLCEAQGDAEKTKFKPIKKCTITLDDDRHADKYIVVKQKQSEIKPTRCTDVICKIETTLTNSFKCLEERFKRYEDFVNCSLRNINDTISKNKSEEELLQYVKSVRLDLEDIRQDVCSMKNYRCTQLKQNEIFQEQIDILKIIKADKETVEEALATKADICEVNQKVSHEQFDAVCDELTFRLNELFSKLNQQETVWQQSFAELRDECDGKIDDLDIPALKEHMKNELQALKNKIQILCEMKREQEAGGARKLLRELRCISCDKDATMQTNAKIPNASNAFPCRASTKPYLTFKLDQVRKQQKDLSQGKNLVYLEKIKNENSDKKKYACPESNDNQSRERTCNRYCGGSHTVISPQQKVMKTKNCAADWGINDLQLVEGFVEGTDGKMYRGRWYVRTKNESQTCQSENICSGNKN